MEDRLKELQVENPEAGGSPSKKYEVNEDKPEELNSQFNEEVKTIQAALSQIKENNQKIKTLKEKHLAATLAEQEKKISKQLNDSVDQNSEIARALKKAILKMEEDVKKAQLEQPDEPETRMKDVTFQSLKHKFADVLKEAQNVAVDYKTSAKSKIARQLKIIDSSLTPDQVDDLCNDPDGAQRLIGSKMLGPAHNKLVNAVSDIQDKYKDIKRLEQSVQAVHKMFEDMEMLVQLQGDMLNNIEVQVNQAKDYVTKANKNFEKAKRHQIASKKCQCYILIILLVLILVIVIPVSLS